MNDRINAANGSPKPFRVAGDLEISDLRAALAAGWADFRAMPQYGLFFGGLFALAGIALAYATIVLGEVSWLIPAVAGFPLLAPFLAVGLYEVSRRREYAIPVDWPAVLGAVKGRGHDQILSMGVILFVGFGFWVIIAHLVFSVFLVEAGAGSESLEFLITPMGKVMLAVGSAIGSVIALVFYAVTVISLPMLVDREVDFLTAIFASLRAFRENRVILLIWAMGIAILMALGVLLAFVGLVLVVPVLGHATWHLYRRTVLTA